MSGGGAARTALGGAAARGGLILGGAGVVENGAQFLRVVLLARVLAPRDFGLMGMAFIALQAGESFSQTGFYRALVQKRGDPEPYLDTVWWISALRGIVLMALVWIAAPLAGIFFSTDEVVPILRAVGLVFVIQGFLNPALFLLERELAFVRYSVPRVVGVVADLVASVLLAWWLRSVWGMVWGVLLGKSVYVLGSYVARPYRPRGAPRRDQVVEFYSYGRHIFRATAVDYLVSQADKAMIGRLLGASALGLYTFAWRIASLPATGLYNVVFRVAFPVFSRLQADTDRLRAGYLRSLGMMAALAAPIAAGLWVVAPDMVSVVFGEKWMAMTPAFRVLCLGGVPLALYYLIGSVLGGVGRPDVSARGAYVLLAVLAAPLYPAIRLGGITGAAWTVSLASLAAFAYMLVAGGRVLGAPPGSCAHALLAPIAAAVLMAGSVLGGRSLIQGPAGPWHLAAEVLLGCAAYALWVATIDRLVGGGLVASARAALRPTA